MSSKKQRRFLFLVNESCFTGPTGGLEDFIKGAIPDSFVFPTESPEGINEIIRGVSEVDGYIAVGGDGTANSVLNAMIRLGRHDRIFGILPIGHENDFASAALGIDSMKDELEQLTPGGNKVVKGFKPFIQASHSDAPITEIDVGYLKLPYAEESYFLNMVGMGLNANLIENRKAMRRNPDSILYKVSTLLSANAYSENYPAQIMELAVNGKHFYSSGEFMMIALMNSSMALNGFTLNPHGDVTDGSFELMLLKRVDMKEFRKIAKDIAEGDGEHIYSPSVMYLHNRYTTEDPRLDETHSARLMKARGIRKVKEIRFTSDMPLPIEVDGRVLPQYTNDFAAGVGKYKIRAITGSSK